MSESRVAFLAIVLGLGIWALAMIGPGHLEAAIFLLLLSALTLIPLIALARPDLGIGALILATPALLFSLDTFLLRLGWFNIGKYVDESWFSLLTTEALHKAALLVLAGCAALWIGFFLPIGERLGHRLSQRLNHLIQDNEVKPSELRIWAVFCTGIGARLYLVASGVGGYFSDADLRVGAQSYVQYIGLVEGLATLALILYACILLRQPNPSWIPFGAMFLIELFTLIFLGFKGQILFRFLFLAIVYVLIRRSFPWQLAIAAAAVLIVLFPINLAVRQSFQEGEFSAGELGAIQAAFINATQQDFSSGTNSSNIAETGDQIIRSSGQLEQFAMMVQYADLTGTRFNGTEYLYPFYSMIPRAIWPGKPSPNRGGWVYNVVYGLPGTSAQAQTVPGNLYINLGWAGVVFGFLLLGIANRAATGVIQHITSIRYLPLVPFIVFAFGMPQSDLGAHMAASVQRLVFSALVLQFLVPQVAHDEASTPSRVPTRAAT